MEGFKVGITVVITQSNYLPWRGWFEMIAKADHLVLYDTVQYTKRDWRNRNRIRSPEGVRWITIPVSTKGLYTQAINETVISDHSWWKSHISILDHALGSDNHYGSIKADLHDAYKSLEGELLLSRINRRMCEWVLVQLGVAIELHDSASLPHTGDATERLVAIALQLGATNYLSGPSAKNYLDTNKFLERGITVEWMDYSTLPEDTAGTYEDSELSIIDLIAREGNPGAFDYMPTIKNRFHQG